MVKPKQDDRGNFTARKRLPDDVREEYGRLYGARHEAKFFAPNSTKSHEVRVLFGEWLAEVESRILAIRAARDGTGRNLTPIQARRLAGDWYEWFIAIHSDAGPEHRTGFEWRRDQVHDAFVNSGITEFDYKLFEADELLQRPRVREAVRPVIADMAETAQFLSAKQMPLTSEARNLFLDYLYDDLGAALELLIRRSGGDYSHDAYPERFSKVVEGIDSGVTPWQLFENWVAERKPARGTIESWRYVFKGLEEHFGNRSAVSITAEEAGNWIKALVTHGRSAAVVKKTWLNAANTVFRWALEHKLIARNPFANVKVTVPKKKQLREPTFRSQETRTILQAALAITDIDSPREAAKRWVPWLCAYTGARPGEITQLRKADVFEEGRCLGFGLRQRPAR